MSLLEAYQTCIEAGTLEPDPAQARVAARLAELAGALAQYRPPARRGLAALFPSNGRRGSPRGLYIHGDVGRGKSMLMDLFYARVRLRAKRRVHFHAFMQEVHDDIHRWRRQGRGNGADPVPPVADRVAGEAHLLCFDEFQVRDIADAMILGRLFEALFERGVVVVATSNTPPDRLYEGGLNRALFLPFIDLLSANMDVLELDGPLDYRLERLRGLEVYHWPLDEGARTAVQTAWERLTDSKRGTPCALEVKGRRILLPQTARGVARAGFAELCGRPLGAGDYLEIAAIFHTLLVEEIPALSAARRDEARRFMHLVDALYEHRCKLIASAEVAPEKLYVAGTGAADFRRTASRLAEMQSAAYMALAHNG